jgi:Flp pilus assembly protein TadB
MGGSSAVAAFGSLDQAQAMYVRQRTDTGETRDYLQSANSSSKGKTMLYTIAVVLLILWILGLVSSYTMGGLIHILLIIALVVIIFNFVSGRRGV